MWEITKDFDFCYGHRVYTQALDAQLSCNAPCKCRHLHGHQGKLKVSLASSKLTSGMVTDFHHLNWFKKWVDEYLDHKMILDLNDPFFKTLVCDPNVRVHAFDPVYPSSNHSLSIFVANEKVLKELSSVEQEIVEGITLVDFVPTSENLAKFVFDWITIAMEAHCKDMDIFVTKVVFEETPKSSSTYRG